MAKVFPNHFLNKKIAILMIEPTHNSRLRERFNISRLAIQYPWLTLGFWIAVVVAGTLAFSSLKYALFPDITFPVVVVNASAPLKTALATEAELTQPIEAQMQGIKGLDSVGSFTYPGQTVVSLNFAVGTDLESSQQAVEGRLKPLDLPTGTTSKVIPINLNEAAVVSYAIEAQGQSLQTLSTTVQTEIIPVITKLPGVLKVNLLGKPTTFDLAQLAKGTEGLNQTGTLVRFNGNPALAIQVVKRGDANTLDVVREVDAAIQRLQTQFPDLQLTLAATQADYIRAATGETIHALIEAIILSTIVIFPFLWNWRATLISALAIPTSLLGTFIVMAVYGFNLETITLLALAMVIGSIVDDAIVDVENISRHLEKGESPRQAAILATNEIGLTVTAATLTAIAVFLPVGMMGGVLGQFFKPFGITIAAAMLTSLLVARTLSPLLAAYWLKPTPASKPRGRMQSIQAGLNGINQSYRRLLNWSLHHRSLVIGIAILSFVVGLGLIPLIPKGFIPKLDRGEFNLTYTAPLPKVPPELLRALQQTQKQGQQQDQKQGNDRAQAGLAGNLANPAQASANRQPNQISNLPKFDPLADSLEVAESLDDYARRSPHVQTVFTVVGSRQGEPNKGSLYIKLKDDRTATTAQVQDQFRQTLPSQPTVVTSVEDIQFVDTGGEKPVQVRIVGDDLTALNQTAQALQQRLADIPGFEDVSTTGEANTDDDIVEIKRLNGARIAVVSANLGPELTLGEATDRAIAEAQTILPSGLSLDLGGDSARVNEILSSFGATLALSVLCILLVLLVLFRSWIDTFVIFLSLPLSVIGAMVGLLIVQSDFGMISLIGIIFLLGLTNKNAILIVDYIKQLRRSGLSRREAILEAGPVRLRPILMTTAATILGMLPIALGLGAGAELRAPMAVAIMGGLVTSTLLSLIVVPVIYDLLDDWR